MIFRNIAIAKFSSYHKTLGVLPSASQEDIKNQYYKLAKMYHPDKNPGQVDKFKLINEAYEKLKHQQQQEGQTYQADNVAPNSKSSNAKAYEQSYHYGQTRDRHNFDKMYAEYKAQQQQYYQFKSEHKFEEYDETKYQQYERPKSNFSNSYMRFMMIFILGMTAYVFIDILNVLSQPQTISLYDKQTGKTFKVTKEQLQEIEVDRKQNKDFSEFRQKIRDRQKNDLRNQRMQQLMGDDEELQ